MRFKLYDYQLGAVNAALGSIGRGRNELIVLPTGSGKSIVLAGLTERLKPSPNRRILIVSHVREILDQNATALARHLPDVSLGLACSGMNRLEFGRDVTVGSVQTLYLRKHQTWNYDVCLVDEAHLINRKEASMYQRLFARLSNAAEKKRKKIPILGLTATPYRLDTGYLHQGEDALFEAIAYDVPVTQLVERGVLAPLTTEPISELGFSKLRIKSGEFAVADYTSGTDTAWLAQTRDCIRQAIGLAKDRKRWIIFCCTVKHAEAVAELLASAGLPAVAVHTETTKRARDEAIREYRAGKLRALINVNVLTTGFDAPETDCLILLRPTLSTGLYVQMVGRGMRRAAGKHDCFVLDFAGNIKRHGPLSDITPAVMRPVASQDPIGIERKCPTCEAILAAWTKQCGDCGHLFAQIEAVPSMADVMAPMEMGHYKRRPPSDHIYLSTEEVAGIVGTTPQYVKQMRHLGTGPKFYRGGAMTTLGWKGITYRVEDVEKWQATLKVYPGKEGGKGEGRLWRWRAKSTPVETT